MIKPKERKKIIELVRREVVPAMGCTEPAAVSLAVAKAAEVLGVRPEKIVVFMSANILKNAMGVGIPGTGMIGLPIAIALGALIGKSEYRLEALKEITPQALEDGKKMIADQRIDIHLKGDVPDKLYIEALVSAGNDTAKAVIIGQHTNICHVEKNGKVLLGHRITPDKKSESDAPTLTMRKLYEFATEAPLEEIDFILEAARLNREAAVISLQGDYGHSIGKTLAGKDEKNMMGNSLLSKILSCTSAACDARMAGAMIPVMTNSGSGNQGITATVPIVVYAEETNQPQDKLIRALMLSHLTAIYIKTYLGRLSALCGCVVAGTGSACGITYMMGGNYQQITYAVQNMIANITGMICDGAKPSCALKVTSGIATAVLSAMMAMEHKTVSSIEGIIDSDVDQSIRNMALIGKDGMNEIDRLVLQMMTGK
jgi:L-cysteine desulfidase